MRLWARLTWVSRAAVVGASLLLSGGIIGRFTTGWPAGVPLLAGLLLLLAAGLSRFRSSIGRASRESRPRLWLTCAWATAAAGVIVFLISLAMVAIPSVRIVAGPAVVAGVILILIGGLAVSWFEIRRNPQGSVTRVSFKWAWRTAAVGSIPFAAGFAILVLVPGGAAVGASLFRLGGLLTLVFPLTVYLITEMIVELSRATDRVTTITLVLLLVAFLILFPPFLIFLATNGNGAAFVNPLSHGPAGAFEATPLFLIPFLLVGIPEGLRRSSLTWQDASESTQRLVPGWLAVGATIATSVYALLLHFFKGPLAGASVSQLAVAVLFAVALLIPFYRSVAAACWQWGVIDLVRLKHWRGRQLEMVREMRWRARMAERQRGQAESNGLGDGAQPALRLSKPQLSDESIAEAPSTPMDGDRS